MLLPTARSFAAPVTLAHVASDLGLALNSSKRRSGGPAAAESADPAPPWRGVGRAGEAFCGSTPDGRKGSRRWLSCGGLGDHHGGDLEAQGELEAAVAARAWVAGPGERRQLVLACPRHIRDMSAACPQASGRSSC